MATPKLVMWEWKSAWPQLAACVAIFALVYLFFSTWQWHRIFMLSAGIYLTYSIASRRLIPRHHRKGWGLLGQKNYHEAISAFEESLAFFARHRWVDSCRAIILMTPSSFSYREMGLLNIAFAYGQLGDGESARTFYEQVVKEYPDNWMAQAVLNIIEASTKLTSRQ